MRTWGTITSLNSRHPPLKKLGMLVHSQRSYPMMRSPMPCRLQRPCVRVQKMISLRRKAGAQIASERLGNAWTRLSDAQETPKDTTYTYIVLGIGQVR